MADDSWDQEGSTKSPPDFRLLYESAPVALLVLAPDAPRFTIVAASEAYLRATRTSRDIVGRGIFEVFPDNPGDPASTGAPARASFERVLATGASDAMAVQKHSIRAPDGGFEERYWSPVNTPVLGPGGAVLFIHHRVEDVTEFVRQKASGAQEHASLERLRTRVGEMEADVIRRGQELQELNRELRAANERLAEIDRERARIAEERVRQGTALLQAISDTSPDVIFAKDRAGRMQFANPATLALIGKPVQEVIGRTDAQYLADPEAASEVMANDRRIMDTGVAEEVEEVVPLPDGTPRVWLSRKSPWRDADGRVLGLLGIATDITERKQAEQALVDANERLREADRRKDEFLAMLSHELRNPLAPIRNGIHILARAEPGSPHAAKARLVIERQAEHLTRLVDDLLDVTRIGRGKVELRRERVDLAQVARRTADDLRSLLEAKGLRFTVEGPGDPLPVDGDPTRLAQVIGNLLQNAGKFTPAGGAVRLLVQRTAQAAEIRVQDTGIGIGTELLAQVFEPFVQGEQSLARSHGGLGLGLALVKGIAALHGGHVRARSDGPGQGAEFLIVLPLAADPADPANDTTTGEIA